MQYVNNLIFLNGAICLFLTIPAYLLWRRSGELLARTLFLTFLAGLLTYLIQLLERENHFVIALLFTSSILPHAMIAYLFSQVAGFPYPWKMTGVFTFLAVFATILLHGAGLPFKVYSSPIVAASGFPILYAFFKGFHYRASLGLFGKVLLFLIGLFPLGLSQYPFTRIVPELAFALYCIPNFWTVAFAISLYSMVLEQQMIKKSQALAQLEATQDRLVEKERKAVIGELSAGLIHEIKNQLGFVSFLGPFMRKLPAGGSDDIKELIGYIYDGRDRTIGLLDEIMGLARNTESKYEMEKVCLEKVIESSIEIAKMDVDVKTKAINFESNFNGEVRINRNKIIQVLLNLLRNAAHAIEGREEYGEITVLVDSNDKHATVSVADNGIGIETDKLKLIWEPFFSTKGEKGTGVGLDLCKRIIEGHNGTIECNSQVDVGTTFTIYLPLEA